MITSIDFLELLGQGESQIQNVFRKKTQCCPKKGSINEGKEISEAETRPNPTRKYYKTHQQ